MPNSPKEIAERLAGEALPCRYDRDPGCRGTAEHGICASCHRRASVAAVIEPLVVAIRNAMNEIGVPGVGYPANVANAYEILEKALAQADGGGDAQGDS